MDNDNQMPPVQPMVGGRPQNEIESILASQGVSPQDMGMQDYGAPGMLPQDGGAQGMSPQDGGAQGMSPQDVGARGTSAQGMGAQGASAQGMGAQGMNQQGMMPQVVGPDGRPMVQQALAEPPKKKDVAGLVKTIAIICLSLVAVTFIGLFIWMTMQYNEERGRDLDKEISLAVEAAKTETKTEMEAQFLEREKQPYKTFAGPVDYGQLTFEYPKSWSVYVAAAATAGGDFNAYFNPEQVDAVGADTINALRVTIRNRSFEDVTAEYQKAMEKKGAELTVQSVTVAGTSANRYTGKIPNTDLMGIIVVFKIRDKTVIMQTDSMNFEGDFNTLLDTVTFNA